MSVDVVDAARRALGPVGVFLPVSFTAATPMAAQRDAVLRFERVGYRATWTNEVVGGKDALVQIAVLLAATERMVFGTGIANIWARPAQTLHAAAATLADAYPGRFVLGLGVGYAEQAAMVGREFGRPLATMRRYVLDMAGRPQLPAPDVSYPRIVGANGPKMLALAGEVADGAFPAMPEPGVVAQARRSLGPDKLIVVLAQTAMGQDVVEVIAMAQEHIDAGADHVVLSVPLGSDFADGVDHLERIAPSLPF